MPGESNDEQRRLRELFLKSRQQMQVVPSPTPTAKPTPAPATAPGRKRFRTPPDSATPKSSPSATPTLEDEEEEAMSEATPEATATPTATPIPSPSAPSSPSPSAPASPPATAAATATATPTPKTRRRWFFFGPRETPSPSKPGEQNNRNNQPIIVEKSGGQSQEDLAPVPDHGSNRWRYLTPAVRRSIDEARVARGRWKYVVVHNSGTRQGSARIFDYYHRHVRRMPNGLAYHFVIGNGSSSGNGQIEVGARWVRQLPGGHVHSDYLNYIGIGICLVGDFNRDLPTQAQYEALEELIRYLRERVGKVDGRYSIVLGHREINPRPTDCPGNRFPLYWLHRTFPN
ncbi:MAG: N-acetylmuramoyl-L-alanine amidase [Verrucomicrobia bacterium]|nr:N-acetylmuramoyl-L-alanine amidase [Verrucomicrobiota bacterium]